MASSQTIILKNDGSVKQRVLGDYINQGNDLVDVIYIGFVDDTIANNYVGTANFELPNGDTNTLVGTYVNDIKLPNDTTNYKGFKITLTQAQTLYYGQLKMSFIVTKNDEVLYSYITSFTINKSVIIADEEKITLSQWNSLVENLSSYQVAYNDYNVRGYYSLVKLIDDYKNLDSNQLAIYYDGSNLIYTFGGASSPTTIKLANYDDISVVANALSIKGGTMQGDIDMGANKITTTKEIDFAPTSEVGTIAKLVAETNGEIPFFTLYTKQANINATAITMSWNDEDDIYFYRKIDASRGIGGLPSPTDDSDAATKEYVDDITQNIREVAEGKCKSLVLRYANVTISSSQFGASYKFYKPNGTEITSWEEFCTYIGKSSTETSYTSNNSIFNSQSDVIELSLYNAFWFVAYSSYSGSNQTIYAFNQGNYNDFISAFKTGDIILITETDVPDRWYHKYVTSIVRFYKMETSKVDLSGYVQKSGDTMSGNLNMNSNNITNVSALTTNEIDNTNGNALVRYKATEGKNVFGGVNYDAVIMGASDRPYYSKSGSDFVGSELALKSDVDSKQNTLVSGTNIKTINNQSLLGNGNITISGSGGSETYFIDVYFGNQKRNTTSVHITSRGLSSAEIAYFKTSLTSAVNSMFGTSYTYDEAVAAIYTAWGGLTTQNQNILLARLYILFGGYLGNVSFFNRMPTDDYPQYITPIILSEGALYVQTINLDLNIQLTPMVTILTDANLNFGGITIDTDSNYINYVE